ncbi:MAG: alpha-L-fucosidase [Clostridia bacterium]|nr:alpha-L-fucosidase [Clostridia bacterium]
MPKTITDNQQNMKNWQDQKFGMFIHWGLFSQPGIGCWSMYCGAMDIDEYAKRANDFNPVKFNAKEWADIAKSAGMKYMVLTAKHHDGFSLWDSKYCLNDHTSMNCPAKKDFVKDFTDACHEAGLLTGLYYSPLDWRFPGFFFPRMYKRNADALREQTHRQLEELVSNYGRVDLLWYDGGEDYWLGHGIHMHKFGRPADFKTNPQVKDFWQMDTIDRMVRTKQPGIICNNRIADKTYGDYFAPEKVIGEFNIDEPWETCDTMTNTWEHNPGSKIRSLRNCIQLLAKVVSNGGNLLLNIGPKPDGSFEENEISRLKEIGAWLEKYGESIYGTRGGPIKVDQRGGTTNKDNVMYFHVFDWSDDEIYMPAKGNPEVTCLNGFKVNVRKEGDYLAISIPFENRQEIDTVLKFTYAEKVTDVFGGVVDYDDICAKSIYKDDSVIVEQLD